MEKSDTFCCSFSTLGNGQKYRRHMVYLNSQSPSFPVPEYEIYKWCFAGVGFALRQIGKSATPVLTVTQNGDEYTIVSSTTFKTAELKFKLGVEFEENTPDGRKMKVSSCEYLFGWPPFFICILNIKASCQKKISLSYCSEQVAPKYFGRSGFVAEGS